MCHAGSVKFQRRQDSYRRDRPHTRPTGGHASGKVEGMKKREMVNAADIGKVVKGHPPGARSTCMLTI